MEMYFIVLARLSAVIDAPHQYAQVALEQNDVRGLSRDVDSRIDRNANVGFMQRRRVIDAVAKISHDVAAPAECLDNALFLVRIDLDEEVGVADTGEKAVLGVL